MLILAFIMWSESSLQFSRRFLGYEEESKGEKKEARKHQKEKQEAVDLEGEENETDFESFKGIQSPTDSLGCK